MLNKIIKAVIGDLDEKRAYFRVMRRANALPREYRYAFRRMRTYIYTVGYPGAGADGSVDLALFDGLLDLLETSAAARRPVTQLTGENVAAFCDELLRAYAPDEAAQKNRLNETIRENIPKENKPC
jgi:DNA-binding ferritin-like protein (Dps family)